MGLQRGSIRESEEQRDHLVGRGQVSWGPGRSRWGQPPADLRPPTSSTGARGRASDAADALSRPLDLAVLPVAPDRSWEDDSQPGVCAGVSAVRLAGHTVVEKHDRVGREERPTLASGRRGAHHHHVRQGRAASRASLARESEVCPSARRRKGRRRPSRPRNVPGRHGTGRTTRKPWALEAAGGIQLIASGHVQVDGQVVARHGPRRVVRGGRLRGVAYRLGNVPMGAFLRTGATAAGLRRCSARPTATKSWGFTTLGVPDGELLPVAQLAMKLGISYREIADLIIVHLTMNEGLVGCAIMSRPSVVQVRFYCSFGLPPATKILPLPHLPDGNLELSTREIPHPIMSTRACVAGLLLGWGTSPGELCCQEAREVPRRIGRRSETEQGPSRLEQNGI